MTDPFRNLGADDDTEMGRDSYTTRHRTPSWVKVFGVLLLALVVVFVILHLTGAAPDTGH